jgi:hypothetical protein
MLPAPNDNPRQIPTLWRQIVAAQNAARSHATRILRVHNKARKASQIHSLYGVSLKYLGIIERLQGSTFERRS